MSILLSGDFHANAVHELSVITKKSLLRKYGQDKFNDIRCHIIIDLPKYSKSGYPCEYGSAQTFTNLPFSHVSS